MKILAVDDTPQNLHLLEVLFQGHGYEVTSARNGVEALEQALHDRFDLIISDILMPQMDGFQLCRAVKAHPLLQDVAFIFYSSQYTDRRDHAFALSLGADKCLVKPQDPHVLLAEVQEVIRQHTGEKPGPPLPEVEEAVYMQQHNERLIHKLEEKMLELEEAHRRLAVSEVQYKTLVEQANDAVLMLDPGGQVCFVNPKFCTWFGYTPEEATRLHLCSLVHPDDTDAVLLSLQRLITGELPSILGELRCLTKSGTHLSIDMSASLIVREGTPIGMQAILRDITERKQMNEQLRQAQKMEAIGQLTGGLAHDFNNMLGVVLGNLDLLEGTVRENAVALKRIHTAQRAAMRGADLTRRLLAFARRQQLNPEPTRVNDLITELLAILPYRLGPEIQLAIHLAADVPPAGVDPAGLEDALLNLAINARDAMPEGGTLTFATKCVRLDSAYPPVKSGEIPAGTYVWISVSDTGHGMSREILEQVFEPFFSTKPRDKGTGLGLAMVYGFMKQSGGNIRLYSEPGHGTTVNLYLPVAEREAMSAPHTTTFQAAPGRGTVLVVDDEVDLLEVAVAYLQEMGFTTLQATDGPSALTVVAETPEIDLVLTDVVMPGGMDGVALGQQIRTQRPDVPVIYTSGFPSSALAECSPLHVDGSLVNKPYRKEQLAEAVHQALARRYHPAP